MYVSKLQRICTLFCLVGALAPTSAAAAGPPATPDLIDRAVREQRIDRDTGTLYLAYALGRPAKLPRAYRSNAPWDGTLPLLRLRAAVPRMRPGPRREEAEDIVSPAASTSNCSSNSTSLPSASSSDHFYVEHGTVAGGLAIADYLTSLEQSWSTEVDAFGWAAPPVAPTPAPGGRYHVRVESLSSGLYGFVSPSGTHAGLVGDNPNTSWNDTDAYASCMVLNRDYSGFPSGAQASLDSTTAHEFNHSIQFGYGALSGANRPDDVFVEGGATWMEDEVFDAANDNYHFLWPNFADSMGEYGGSPYNYWIAFRGLTERYGTGLPGGGEQVMQDFWEETSKNTGNNLTAMQTALANRGTNLADAFHAYAITVKFRRACGGGYAYPHCLEEGPSYPTSTALNPHHTIGSVGGATPTNGANRARLEDNYALNWVALPTAGPYDVTLENLDTGGGQLRATIACDTGGGLSLSPLPSVVGANGSASLAGYNPPGCVGAPVAVVTNQTQTAANPTGSNTRNYRVSTAAVGGPPPDPTLTVSKAGSGSGTVTSAPSGINCGTDCAESYGSGTTVTLTASPAAGSSFAGWSGGGCSGTGVCEVTLNANTTVTATFALPQHSLTVTREGSGTITSSPAGISCGSVCSAAFDQGQVVTLTASPASGWSFSGWGGDCAGSTTQCNVTMSQARNATATFTANPTPDPPPPPPEGEEPAPSTGTTATTESPSFAGPVAVALVDQVAPRLSLMRLAPTRFRVARRGPSARLAAVGTTVRFTLSEPARALFRVQRSLIGRRVGTRCVRTAAWNRRRARCVRWVRLRGSFSLAVRAGSNAVRFTGRLAGRPLSPGSYRLEARATDRAGNSSVWRRAAFRVIR